MKVKCVFIITILVLTASISCTQVQGYLGKKVQIQVNFSPNIGLNLRDEYVEANEDVSEELLLGGKSGIGIASLYKGINGSVSYVVSRKGAVGLQVGRNQLFGEGQVINYDSYYQDYSAVLVQLVNTSYQLNYTYYAGIAPLKKYIKTGFGIDVITVDQDKFDVNDVRTSLISDVKDVVPFLMIGLGGNEFVSKSMYINYGIDFNLSTANSSRDENVVSTNEFKLKTKTHLPGSKLFELNLGIGVNL